MLFFNFYLFPPKFQMTIVKNLKMNFECSLEVLLRQKYFWSTHLFKWNDSPFKSFQNFHENAFCFFIFLKERNITTSLLVIHLKCAVMHYANLNLSTISKSFLNYGPLNMLFPFFFFFFRFLIYVCFNEVFVKKFIFIKI